MNCHAPVESSREKELGIARICQRTAKYLVIAAGAPKAVCGIHARKYAQSCLVPVSVFGPKVNLYRFPDINGFLDTVKHLGMEVTVAPPVITINFGVLN